MIKEVLLLHLKSFKMKKKMKGFRIKTKRMSEKRRGRWLRIEENCIWLPSVTKKMTAKKSRRGFALPMISML